MKKVMALLLSIAMMLSLTAVEVMADDEAVTLDLSEGSIVISATGYKQGSGKETPFTGAYTIVQNDTTYMDRTISVTGGTQKITMGSAVDIDVHGKSGACAFSIEKGASVELVLAGPVTLKSGEKKAGLSVPTGAAVTISAAKRAGSLSATGGNSSAGIGGSSTAGGSITILSGPVEAFGGMDGAGIGGSRLNTGTGTGETIHISGGEITAKGNTSAGIGGGAIGSGTGSNGQIIIDGTAVVVASAGFGAGIGGGARSNGTGTSGKIIVGGSADVTASASNGAGIGSGCGYGEPSSLPVYLTGEGGEVLITEQATVRARSVSGAGIGGGKPGEYYSNGHRYYNSYGTGSNGKLTINGSANVTATSTNASGIGAGAYSTAPSSESYTTGPNGVISISGNAVVNATGKFYGIGAYNDDGNGALAISGGTVTARATDEKASDSCGIGRIARFTVSGGTVNASGYTGIYSATVNGGVVTAESNQAAKGIGSLSSGQNRNGWVVSKPAQAAHRMNSGVLFSGDEGKIIGEYCELPASLREIPAGAALTVDAGQELLVPAGGTLRVSGKLIANGKLVVEGTLDTAAGGEVEVNGESNITGSITGNRLPLVIQTKDETTEATSFDVSTLFTIPANAGAVSYTVTGRNGASGKLEGTIFTVENGGVFEVKASVQESAHYQAAEATALLTARNGSQPHVHVKIEFEAKAPDCLNPGNIRYWACENCGKCFSDESCETEISYESTILPATGHKFENGACTACGAEDPSYAGTAVIEVGSLTAYPGDTIEIPVSLRNNPGVTSFKLTVHYDDTLLSYQSLAFDEALTAIEGSKTLVNAEQRGQVTLAWVATGSNYSGSGNVAVLTFKVNAAQENTNTQLSATYDEDDVFNSDFVNQHFLAKAGSVQVNTVRPGDINGDGKVDAMDAMLLLHYVCGLKQNEVKGNPDVNGDGKTNNKDVVILLRYVAGWEGITLH